MASNNKPILYNRQREYLSVSAVGLRSIRKTLFPDEHLSSTQEVHDSTFECEWYWALLHALERLAETSDSDLSTQLRAEIRRATLPPGHTASKHRLQQLHRVVAQHQCRAQKRAYVQTASIERVRKCPRLVRQPCAPIQFRTLGHTCTRHASAIVRKLFTTPV